MLGDHGESRRSLCELEENVCLSERAGRSVADAQLRDGRRPRGRLAAAHLPGRSLARVLGDSGGSRRSLCELEENVCLSERAGRSVADAQLRDGRREAASDEGQRGALNGDGGEALGPRVKRGVQAGILRAG